MEPARVEAIEGEIDRIIEKRSAERRDANRVEELWKESTERHNKRRWREVGAAWYEHHCRMHDVHARLASEHEEKALSLLNGGNRGEGGR